MTEQQQGSFDLAAVAWEKMDGLVPAIVQDAFSLRMLMLGYMNREALEMTRATGKVTFYSRSKQRLWQKGESSGHVLTVNEMRLDCDGDAILIKADPAGPTCHTGTLTCWGDETSADLATLADLARTIQARRSADPERSYTAKLFARGLTRIAQKVGEEGVETALAGATRADNLLEESADLLYHLLVLLEASDKSLLDVLAVLRGREKK